MPVVHQFAYGPANPVIAFVMAFVGSMFGLSCTARAREADTSGRRARWLILGALALGGAGIWLMHFMATLGFEVASTDMRLDPVLTVASFGIAVVAVASGLFLVGFGRGSIVKIFFGGVSAGGGVAAMHYTGMAALHLGGHFSYDPALVYASVIIAVAAAIVAFWLTVMVRGWKSTATASAIMAVAVCAMHYTAMAAMQVHLDPAESPAAISGISPLALIVPITVVAVAAAMGLVFGAMAMMGDEEFQRGPELTESMSVSPVTAAIPEQRTPVSLREFDAQWKKDALRSRRDR